MRRFLLFAFVAALAGAPAAPPAPSPRDPPAELFVDSLGSRPGLPAEVGIDLAVPTAGRSSLAAATVYVPAGYALDLDRPPGSVVGQASLSTVGGRAASALLVAAGGQAPGGPVACPGAARAALWRARVRLGRAVLPLVVLAERTRGGESALGSYRLALCPPSTVHSLTGVRLDLQAGVTNPPFPGLFAWRALVIPAGPGPPARPVELRSVVAIPQELTLHARAADGSTLVLAGRLTAAGSPRAEIAVHLVLASRPDLADARELPAARTGPDGRYALSVRAPRPAASAPTVLAYVNFYAGACAGAPAPTATRCAEQTFAPPEPRVAALAVPRVRRSPTSRSPTSVTGACARTG
ncbi:MAG TPA: hypothetical protein VFA44_04595 [Gaiellaceae bacterium]|nr:hypothetical protein [Gaiellaceae bacterium]